MEKFIRGVKTLSLAVGAASILFSCSSGTGAPTSLAPGGASTVTGLCYNEEDGFEVGKMSNKLMEKVEELTLYLIDANKRIEQLEKQLVELNK